VGGADTVGARPVRPFPSHDLCALDPAWQTWQVRPGRATGHPPTGYKNFPKPKPVGGDIALCNPATSFYTPPSFLGNPDWPVPYPDPRASSRFPPSRNLRPKREFRCLFCGPPFPAAHQQCFFYRHVDEVNEATPRFMKSQYPANQRPVSETIKAPPPDW